jgi:hypothetical protein
MVESNTQIYNSLHQIKFKDFLPSQTLIHGILINSYFGKTIKLYLLKNFPDYIKYSVNNNIIKYIDPNIFSIVSDVHFEYNNLQIHSNPVHNIKNKKFNNIETKIFISRLIKQIQKNIKLLIILKNRNIQIKNNPNKHYIPKNNTEIFLKKSNATKNREYQYDIEYMFDYIINYIEFINFVYKHYINIINTSEYIIISDFTKIINSIKPLYITKKKYYKCGTKYKDYELKNIKFPKIYINNSNIYYSNDIIIRCNTFLKKNITAVGYTIFPKRIEDKNFKIKLDSTDSIKYFNKLF